jgi:hypothetical protein
MLATGDAASPQGMADRDEGPAQPDPVIQGETRAR